MARFALTITLLVTGPLVLAQRTSTTGTSYDEMGQMALFLYTDGGWAQYIYDNEVSVASRVTYYDYAGVTRFHASDMTYNYLGVLRSLRRLDNSINAAISYGHTE